MRDIVPKSLLDTVAGRQRTLRTPPSSSAEHTSGGGREPHNIAHGGHFALYGNRDVATALPHLHADPRNTSLSGKKTKSRSGILFFQRHPFRRADVGRRRGSVRGLRSAWIDAALCFRPNNIRKPATKPNARNPARESQPLSSTFHTFSRFLHDGTLCRHLVAVPLIRNQRAEPPRRAPRQRESPSNATNPAPARRAPRIALGSSAESTHRTQDERATNAS